MSEGVTGSAGWPVGWPRTPPSERRRWPGDTRGAAVALLALELKAFGASHYAVAIDRDGTAAWLRVRQGVLVLACDRWADECGNARALTRILEALRAIMRLSSPELAARVLAGLWVRDADVPVGLEWEKVDA